MAIWHVSLVGLWYNQAMVNTIKYNGPDTPTSLQAFVDAMGAEFKARIQPTMHTSATWQSVHIRKVQPAAPGLDFVPASWPFVGTLAGNAMPAYVAVPVKLQGTDPNYPFRGSARLGGVIEEDVTSGALVAGAVTTRWELAADFWAFPYTVSGQTWTPVLWTERYAPVFNVISSAIVNIRVSTQNSRKIGRGG